jgi:Skp family chaperone for outer membrane proteins
MRFVQWSAALVAAALTILGGAAPAFAVDKTWAVFDSKRAMEETEHFQAAKAAFEKQVAAREKKLEGEKEALEERREALEAKKAVSSSEALVEQEGKLVQEEQQLAQRFVRTQRELALFEKKIGEQLLGRLQVVVQEVANRRGHTFVVEAAKVLYNVPALDITEDVIAAYEKRFGDKPLDLSAVKLSQRGAAEAGGKK